MGREGHATHAGQQDLQDKEDAGQEAEAEPTDPTVDPHAYGQQNSLQREAPPLAPHEDWAVSERHHLYLQLGVKRMRRRCCAHTHMSKEYVGVHNPRSPQSSACGLFLGASSLT